jgi:hypothetical protein
MRRRFARQSLRAAALLAVLVLGCAAAASRGGAPRDLSILQRWTGDYPLAQLDRLPEEQRHSRVGYFSTPAAFTRFWQGFKPETAVPAIDFSKNLVVFARNVDRYHRTLIAKVTLTAGVAEIIDIRTASSAPVDDTLGMALALIPRDGIEFIQRGKERVPVWY